MIPRIIDNLLLVGIWHWDSFFLAIVFFAGLFACVTQLSYLAFRWLFAKEEENLWSWHISE